MSMMNRFPGLISGLVAGMLVSTAATAAAHEEGVLRVASRQLVAGSTFRVSGEKFGGGTTLTMVLVGVRGRFKLGEVGTDAVGAFDMELAVPADLPNGTYRLVAIVSDGDEVATLDVAVVAMTSVEESRSAGEEERGAPTAEPMALDRAGSPWVTGGTLVGIVVAVVFGAALLRRSLETT